MCVLNAGTCDPGRVTGTGKPEIDSAMINLACGGLKKKYMTAMTIKWGGTMNQADIDSLSEFLLGDVSKIAVSENWKYKKGTLLKMCILAVKELHSNKIFNTDVKKANEIGVCRQSYSKKYSKYYSEIFLCLDEYTNIAYSHIFRRLNF